MFEQLQIFYQTEGKLLSHLQCAPFIVSQVHIHHTFILMESRKETAPQNSLFCETITSKVNTSSVSFRRQEVSERLQELLAQLVVREYVFSKALHLFQSLRMYWLFRVVHFFRARPNRHLGSFAAGSSSSSMFRHKAKTVLPCVFISIRALIFDHFHQNLAKFVLNAVIRKIQEQKRAIFSNSTPDCLQTWLTQNHMIKLQFSERSCCGERFGKAAPPFVPGLAFHNLHMLYLSRSQVFKQGVHEVVHVGRRVRYLFLDIWVRDWGIWPSLDGKPLEKTVDFFGLAKVREEGHVFEDWHLLND